MKRSELLFNIASIPVDMVSLFLAGLVSFYIRLTLQNQIPIVFELDFHKYVLVIFEVMPVLLFLFMLAGLYNLRGTRKFSREFVKIVGAISIALLLGIVIFFFNQTFFPSRLIVLTAWVASIIFMVIGRFILRLIQQMLFNRGYGLHRLVIIDGPKSDSSLITEFKNNKELGYKVVDVLDDTPDLVPQIEEIYRKHPFEEILQANPTLSEKVNLDLVEFARSKGLNFTFVPNIFNVQRSIIETDTVSGIPVISLKNTPLEGWGRVVKRIFDVIVSLLCIIISSPLLILIPIIIKLDSRGRVLYAAPRGGRGKSFTFYKFRTMYSHLSVGEQYGGTEAEKMRQDLWKMNVRGGEEGPFLKIKDDPRVTKFGRFLRKTKLDELPQFFNVLKGDMSMVGPRAHVIDEVERYRERYMRMFTIKPGIFGLSQIAQILWPDLPFEEEIRLNVYYIENWSVWLDITVLAKSFYYLIVGSRHPENY